MNTATCITRLTMIAAALAAAVTVQAAPAGVVEMPTVTVIGQRVVQMPTVVVTGKREIVEMPAVTVIGKRGGDAGPVLVAQKAVGAAPLKPASRV